jgi:hypothetical protein
LFKKLEASHKLRIWIASRYIKEMAALCDFSAKVSLDEITLDDTSYDIRTYADRLVGSILPDGALDVKDGICKTIVQKAQGSFLWVFLAIEQLENKWHTPEAIREALEDLPDGMGGFYDRMMATIAAQPATRALACCILTWAMCSFRPLSLAEIEVALAYEFPRLVNLESTIAQACASFVVVRNAHIALLHDTARAFLLDRDGALPLSIDLRQGEAHLAEICLRFLILQGNDLRRILSSATPTDQDGVPRVFDEHQFLEYAVTWWAYHLGQAPYSQALSALAQDFLRRFTLVWIHAVALLRILTRAAESLLRFVEGSAELERERSLPPGPLATLADSQGLGRQQPPVHELFEWATDLRRIVWRFGSDLINYPLSVYRHMVPFCPSESMICQWFPMAKSLTMVGDAEQVWPERVARLSIPEDDTWFSNKFSPFRALGCRSNLGLITA